MEAMTDTPKTITLDEYRRLVEKAQAEKETWKEQEYLGETIYTTPAGRCFWESANWWASEEEVKKNIRNEVWQVWVGNIWTLRNILHLHEEKGGPTEDDKFWGWTTENIEKRIEENFAMLSKVFGLTREEIEDGVKDYIAYRQSFESLPSGSRERSDAIHNNKPLLPEKGHQYIHI